MDPAYETVAAPAVPAQALLVLPVAVLDTAGQAHAADTLALG